VSGGVLPVGKLKAELLRELLAAGPPLPPEVQLGPAVGEDACAIAVPAGVLVAAADPITLTGRGVGSHAVVVNANDVAVMGVRPRWFLAVVLLPEGTPVEDVRALFGETREALERIGAALVGGHTEVTPAVRQPVVVGQFLGLSEDGRFIPTGGVLPDDRVLQVGPAPLEGAAVLAAEAGPRLAEVPREAVDAARRAIQHPGISVVESALEAARLGVHALHDPTEGGLATGLHELAEASGVGLVVDEDAVVWFEPGREVCRAVGADPWGTLASGTLLAAFPPDIVESAERALRSRGHPVAMIARAEPGAGARTRSGKTLPRFDTDEIARVLGGP
jgi:hydrogenase expression/formation protein HypE